jgi:hypothetical protein
MQKLFKKKRERKKKGVKKKWISVRDLKQWVLRCLPKKEMNKIVLAL